jgi:hypothetical protein
VNINCLEDGVGSNHHHHELQVSRPRLPLLSTGSHVGSRPPSSRSPTVSISDATEVVPSLVSWLASSTSASPEHPYLRALRQPSRQHLGHLPREISVRELDMGKGAAPDDLRVSTVHAIAEDGTNPERRRRTLLLCRRRAKLNCNGGRADDVNCEREEVGQISVLRPSAQVRFRTLFHHLVSPGN